LTPFSHYPLHKTAEKGWELVAAAHEEADRVKGEMKDTLFFADPQNHIRKA